MRSSEAQWTRPLPMSSIADALHAVVRTNTSPFARLHHATDPPFEMAPGKTGLVIVDMQYLDAHRDYGLGVDARHKGMMREVADYFEQVDAIVPRINTVMTACRRAGIEVIHVRVACHTLDGRDAPPAARRPDYPPRFDAKEAQILDELAPLDDEIVLSKTTVSAFTSTPLDFILRNIGINNLLICGVVTGGCVLLTARQADDLGYRVIVIGDCCASPDVEAANAALEQMNQFRMRVKNMDDVLPMLPQRR